VTGLAGNKQPPGQDTDRPAFDIDRNPGIDCFEEAGRFPDYGAFFLVSLGIQMLVEIAFAI
jgi:hypothetical protein